MSLLLRSLLREPVVTRPISRAIRRFDDGWLSEWPVRKARRTSFYDSPFSVMEDMNRQMASTLNRMQDVFEDLAAIDEIVDRFDSENRPRKRRDLATIERTESGELQLALDVSEYKPEDLKIKLVDDNLVIEGNTKQSGKDSYQSHSFKRWFKVPEDCKLDDISSKLTDDNRLVINLPMNKPAVEERARTIPIEMSKSKEGENKENPRIEQDKENASN